MQEPDGAAEADIISPAVAAEDPLALLDELVFQFKEILVFGQAELLPS